MRYRGEFCAFSSMAHTVFYKLFAGSVEDIFTLLATRPTLQFGVSDSFSRFAEVLQSRAFVGRCVIEDRMSWHKAITA